MVERNTGIFIDAENVIGGYGGGRKPFDMRAAMDAIRRRLEDSGHAGRSLVCRAYADWARSQVLDLRRQLRSLGVETVHVEGSSLQVKNAADIHLAIDAVTWAFEKPSMEALVIVSGDGGLVPLVRQLQALGKYVAGAAREGSASEMLKGVCDDFLELAPAADLCRDPSSSDPRLETSSASTSSSTGRLALTWAEELLAVTGELLDGAESVDFQRVVKALRDRLGVQSVAGLLSGTRPIDASARVFRGSEFVLARYPENPGVWLAMRRSLVPGMAEEYRALESETRSTERELPTMRSIEYLAAGAEEPTASTDFGAETTWFRDREVGRALLPKPSVD